MLLDFPLPFSPNAASVVLGDDNYDGTNSTTNNLVATQNVTVTTGAGPGGSSGSQGIGDLATGGQWGEARGFET